MGQGYSYALDHTEQQFVHVQQLAEGEAPRRNIMYNELLQIEMPDDLRVNLNHIAVLFCLDANRDGAFSYDDLVNFAMWLASTLPKDISSDEFHDAVQARCILRLWKACREEGGNDVFVNWICGFLGRSHPVPVQRPTPQEAQQPGVPNVVIEIEEAPAAPSPGVGSDTDTDSDIDSAFAPHREELFSIEAVRTLYVVANVAEGYGLDFESFCFIIRGETGVKESVDVGGGSVLGQCHSIKDEEAATLSGENIRVFLSAFIDSYWGILSKLGLEVLMEDDEDPM